VTTLIELDEHEAAERALTADELLALQGSRMIDVQPGWRHGTYRLKAGHIVGVLDLGAGLTLRIRPKLPVRRVVYLLCYAAGLARWDERLVDLDDDAPIDVALAEAFASASERTLRRGPHSAYFTVDDDLAEIRGRVDANRQRLRYGLPMPVSVTYDEYGVDIPENQLLLGAAIQLQRLSALSGLLRRRLRRIAVALEGVRPARRDQARIPVHLNRLNEHYRAALALARATLEGESFNLQGGDRALIGFTVNMNRLFEKFLEVGLEEALRTYPEGRLNAQRSDHLDKDRSVRIVPDLTWTRNTTPAVVIDAKYKNPSDAKASDEDLYQIVSYCIGLGINRGFLVHATTAASSRLAIRSSTIEVTVTGLDLAAPIAQLQDQIAELGKAIAAHLIPSRL
jgi:5-methylcytosine-specific restriction enzyme subunit McrC